MGSENHLKPAGLYTQPSLIGEDIPDGAQVVADNVAIRREGIIEPRRGVSAYATATCNRLFSYQDRLISHTSTGTLSYDNGSGTFTGLTGTFAPPSATTAKTRAAQAAQNLYLTTSAGPYRMDAYSSVPLLSGAIKATGFDRDGRVYTCSATNASLTSNVVTVTTTAAHGFYVGQVIVQTSATEGTQYITGTHTVTTAPTSTSFTYAQTAGDDAASANIHTYAPAALREATIGTPGGGFLTDGNHVAYRVVFNCPDTNNTEKPGAASPRTIIDNASGTVGWVTTESRNVVLRVFVPSGVTTSHSVRLYRSKQVATTIEPDDDLQLVYESLVKTPEITQGWMDITDVTPDALRGAAGYFAPSQEGIIKNNERPPLCNDMALFGGSMHYANTTGSHRIKLSLLGVGSPNGLQDGDLLTVDNDVYTASTTPTLTAHFKLETGGTASQNIRNTALNLCAAVNRATANNSSAFYTSGPDDLPGQITIERKALGGSSFYPTLSGSTATDGIRTAWNPVLNAADLSFDLSRTSNVVTATVIVVAVHNLLVGEQVTLTDPSGTFSAGPHTILSVNAAKTTFTYAETAANDTVAGRTFTPTKVVSSSAEANPSRVFHSKVNQPEAVPLLQYNDVGRKDADILRILATRDSMFAFKEDGLFRGTGGNGSFTWKLFDPTVILLAPDSAVVLNNQIYAWTTQGVLAISDSGSELISRPIEKTLTKLMADDLTSCQRVTFGIGYESDRTYELRTISAASETTCTQAFIFNTISRTWVRDTITTKCGVVHPADDKRYLGGASQILKERKAFTYADYQDVSVAVTVSSVTASTVVLSSATGVSVGDIINQGAGYGRITGVSSNTLTIAAEDRAQTVLFTAAAGTVIKAIASTIQWAPFTAGDPAKSKIWQETNFLMGNAHLASATASHSTELIQTFADTTVSGLTTAGQWTTAAATWDGTERPFNLRICVPQEDRRSTRLNLKLAVTNALSAWNLSGLSLVLSGGSERTSR